MSKEEVLVLWDALVVLFTDQLQFLENLKGEIKGLLESCCGTAQAIPSLASSAARAKK